MRIKPSIILALVTASTVLLLPFRGVPSVAAATNSHSHFLDGPYNFGFTAGQCGLPLSVSGSATYDNVSNVSTDASGAIHVEFNSTAIGTATDSAGVTYHYNYANHTSFVAGPSGLPVSQLVVDHFNLDGPGSDSGLHVGFVYRVSVSATGDVTFTVLNSRGDPACDPI